MAQRGDATISLQGLDGRPVGDMDLRFGGGGRICAQLRQFGPQRDKAGMIRIVATERFARVPGLRNRRQNFGRNGAFRLQCDRTGNTVRPYPAGLGVVGISKDRPGNDNFGFGDFNGGYRPHPAEFQAGCAIGCGVEAVLRGLAQAGDDAMTGMGHKAAIGPDRLPVAGTVEGRQGGPFIGGKIQVPHPVHFQNVAKGMRDGIVGNCRQTRGVENPGLIDDGQCHGP